MIIRIKNLRLRTVIGINEWERKALQDVIINMTLTFDGSRAAQSDHIADTVNYKKITKQVIAAVENSEFYLLETLADHILKLVMADERIHKALIEVDKPKALRFADSVSVSIEGGRNNQPADED